MLNGQNLSWTNVHVGVPQRSILGSLLFLIYINDSSDNLTSSAKLFLLMIHHQLTITMQTLLQKGLNDDLKKVNDWTFQWKMSFDSDPKKQVQEVIFSRKSKRLIHPPFDFQQQLWLSHLHVILDFKLSMRSISCCTRPHVFISFARLNKSSTSLNFF